MSKIYEEIFHQNRSTDGMAIKNMKRCSASLAIREIKIKSKWYITVYLLEQLKWK